MELTREAIIRRAITGRCPRCGHRGLFATRFRLHEHCPSCRLPFEQEDGWATGALPLNYTFTCLAWILPIGILLMTGVIPLAIAAILAGAGAILIPLLCYRFFKSLWVGIYYAILPHEAQLRTDDAKGDVHQ